MTTFADTISVSILLWIGPKTQNFVIAHNLLCTVILQIMARAWVVHHTLGSNCMCVWGGGGIPAINVMYMLLYIHVLESYKPWV